MAALRPQRVVPEPAAAAIAAALTRGGGTLPTLRSCHTADKSDGLSSALRLRAGKALGSTTNAVPKTTWGSSANATAAAPRQG